MKARAAILLAVFALCSACQSEKEASVAAQELAIEKWISTNHSEKEIRRNGGVSRIVVVLGDRDSVERGDMVTVALDGYVFTGSPSTQFCRDTVTAPAGEGRFIKGVDLGLMGAMAGEESYIVFNAKYGFYDETIGTVPPMSALAYYVTVLEIAKQ